MNRAPRSALKMLNLCCGLAFAAAIPTGAAFANPPPHRSAEERDGRHDFDFLVGRWYAHSRRMRKPLEDPDQWQEFDSVHDGVLLPSGFGVADDYRIEGRPDFIGLALQIYDPGDERWQAYWYRLGVLTPPLRGAFRDGVGVFEGQDEHNGKPIRTRYIWSHITRTSARWEQAFSADGGKTWEVNWIMEYQRTRAGAAVPGE